MVRKDRVSKQIIKAGTGGQTVKPRSTHCNEGQFEKQGWGKMKDHFGFGAHNQRREERVWNGLLGG